MKYVILIAALLVTGCCGETTECTLVKGEKLRLNSGEVVTIIDRQGCEGDHVLVRFKGGVESKVYRNEFVTPRAKSVSKEYTIVD